MTGVRIVGIAGGSGSGKTTIVTGSRRSFDLARPLPRVHGIDRHPGCRRRTPAWWRWRPAGSRRTRPGRRGARPGCAPPRPLPGRASPGRASAGSRRGRPAGQGRPPGAAGAGRAAAACRRPPGRAPDAGGQRWQTVQRRLVQRLVRPPLDLQPQRRQCVHAALIAKPALPRNRRSSIKSPGSIFQRTEGNNVRQRDPGADGIRRGDRRRRPVRPRRRHPAAPARA